MRLNRLLVILTLIVTLSVLPSAQAVCSFDSLSPYPGWEARFNGSVEAGDIIEDGFTGTVGMGNLSIEIREILGGEIANVKVFKKGTYDEVFSVTESSDNFDLTLEDIRLKVVDVTATTINLTVFTHDRSVLNASGNITYEIPDLNGSLPGGEVELDIEIRNLGEVKAENIKLVESFGEFEVVSRDIPLPNSMCANTSVDIEYFLTAPQDLREDTNYIIYLEFTYSGYNSQLLVQSEHTTEIPITIAVRPTLIDIAKDSGNFTLLNEGSEITIFNTVHNTGNTTAFNVDLIDTPPSDFTVVSGQPSLSLGRIFPGEEKTRSYTVISNDPLYCFYSSKSTYKDERGNSYTSFSDKVGTRFSPFVTLTKTFKDNPLYQNFSYDFPIRTRQSMKTDYSTTEPASVEFTSDAIMKSYEGDIYYSLCPGEFLKGDSESCVDDNVPSLLINRSSDVTVTLKNAGNTIARDVNSTETLKNIDYTGNISWNGTLLPGEEVSYTYTAVPIKKDTGISTFVSYSDVDPLSVVSDIEGSGVGLCTKKLTTVSFNSTANFSYTFPDLHVSLPSEIKIYEDSSFDFMPVVFNNGTERLFDIDVTIDYGNLTLTKGQKITKLGDLGRGFGLFGQFDRSCNIAEWNNINITRIFRHFNVIGAGKSEIIYQVKDGTILVYVDGAAVGVKTECDEDGLSITHNVPRYVRFPFHSPAEPGDAEDLTLENIDYMIYGNPIQREYSFFTPQIEEQITVPITTTVTYEDVFGNMFKKKFTTLVAIVPAEASFAIVRVERADLGVAINYTNITDLGEPGQLNLELTSEGFGPIEEYVLNLTLPEGVEVSTNDTTNWTGRIEAQIRRVNDTLFVFSGEISKKGNITTRGMELIPLTIRGTMPGTFYIPYNITYDDGKKLDGSFSFKVRGPVLKSTKQLSKSSIDQGEEITVTLKVKNTGDGDATSVIISDGVPVAIPIISGEAQLRVDVLRPGEEVNVSYTITATTTVEMGGTRVSWQDIAGNAYIGDLEPILLKVAEPPEDTPPAVTEAPQTQPPVGRIFPQDEGITEGIDIDISLREGVGVAALALVVLIIIFKLVTLKIPAKEVE